MGTVYTLYPGAPTPLPAAPGAVTATTISGTTITGTTITGTTIVVTQGTFAPPGGIVATLEGLTDVGGTPFNNGVTAGLTTVDNVSNHNGIFAGIDLVTFGGRNNVAIQAVARTAISNSSVWGFNALVQAQAGTSFTSGNGLWIAEFDVNNFGTDSGTLFTAAQNVRGITVATGGSKRPQFAIGTDIGAGAAPFVYGIRFSVTGTQASIWDSGADIISQAASLTHALIEAHLLTAAAIAYVLTAGGSQSWGDGSSAPDVTLRRSAAGQLQISSADADQLLITGTGGTRAGIVISSITGQQATLSYETGGAIKWQLFLDAAGSPGLQYFNAATGHTPVHAYADDTVGLVENGGSVGVGYANGTEASHGKLDVNGSVYAAGAVTVSGGAKISSGTGVPNSVVVGSKGDLWLRTDGGAATTLWVKESGSATNTGWVGK